MAIFVSAPVAIEMYNRGGKAYMAGEMSEAQAFEAATPPLREFLLQRTTENDLQLFYDAANLPRPTSADEVRLRIAIPAFIISELRTAFEMGLTILLPFLVIDLIAAAVLTSLGMVMVPARRGRAAHQAARVRDDRWLAPRRGVAAPRSRCRVTADQVASICGARRCLSSSKSAHHS